MPHFSQSFNSLSASKSGRSKSLSRGMSSDKHRQQNNHPVVLTPIGNQSSKNGSKLSAPTNEDTSATSGTVDKFMRVWLTIGILKI